MAKRKKHGKIVKDTTTTETNKELNVPSYKKK